MDNAKLSGELLGIAISLGLIFSNQTISLAGFSLGSQVTKSCLQTLFECGAHHIVHQTAFIAGATHFNSDEEAVIWNNKIFGNTVSGKISNVFSKNDSILSKLYAWIEQQAIGSKPIFVGMDKNKGKNEEFKNDHD
jgi:hypothetical protein